MYLTNLLAIALTLATPQAATSTTSQSETGQILKAQSQELLDAVTYGKPEVWDRYLDEHAVITTEDGKVHTKAEMVKDIKPLPEGVSGTLIVTEGQTLARILQPLDTCKASLTYSKGCFTLRHQAGRPVRQKSSMPGARPGTVIESSGSRGLPCRRSAGLKRKEVRS
jgi:hypothetical protein